MDRGTRGRRGPRSGRGVIRVALAAALLAPLGVVQAAHAATVYELEGEWAAGTPSEARSGDPLASTWRFNLNDDDPAPRNDPVADVVVEFTAENARFARLPPTCLSTGSPPSGIADDRTTLVCNLGTRPQGSAEIVLADVVAYGPPGAEAGLSARVGGRTASLPPIPLVGDFARTCGSTAAPPSSTSSRASAAWSCPGRCASPPARSGAPRASAT